MALQDAILAALMNGESSGYDLAKSFDVTVANFWTATPQQLYRELDKMLESGLISGRTVEQQRRPNKRMFSLTETGREALREFISRPPKPIAIRDDLLIQVEAMDAGDISTIKIHVQDKLTMSEKKLKRYEKQRDYLLDGRSEDAFLADSPRLGSYLTLARGIAFETENIRWCESALTTLSRRATHACRGS